MLTLAAVLKVHEFLYPYPKSLCDFVPMAAIVLFHNYFQLINLFLFPYWLVNGGVQKVLPEPFQILSLSQTFKLSNKNVLSYFWNGKLMLEDRIRFIWMHLNKTTT